jgi:hypothetical protein
LVAFSAKPNRSKTKSCSDQVFNFKLGCFAVVKKIKCHIETREPRVENLELDQLVQLAISFRGDILQKIPKKSNQGILKGEVSLYH